jgi:thermostable 8-oxoguanine DNA glycosylase
MEGRRIPRRMLEWKPVSRRIRGRPRKRWIEDVEEDFQAMGIRAWRKLSKEIRNGRKSLRRLKPIVGCNANKRRRRNYILYSTTLFLS